MAEGTITVVAKCKAKPGQEAALKAALTALIAPTQKDPGYLAYDLYESTQIPGEFVLVEKWASRELLASHLATPHLTAFQAKTPELTVAPMTVGLYAELPGF